MKSSIIKKSILLEIQDTVVKYADVISNIINADVEIVDKNLVRVAGTGIYKDEVNKDISKEGYVYKSIMKTRKTQVIEMPGSHILCKKCNQKRCCVEKMLVCTPITLNDDIIGVIGLVCSTEKQRDHFVENLNPYLQLLEQISDFISAKAYEQLENERKHNMLELLDQIIEGVDKGVLVTKNTEIVHMNASAAKQLNLPSNNISKKITIVPTGEHIMGGEVYTVAINNKRFELVGNLIPAFSVVDAYDKILMFHEIKQLKSEIYKMTGETQIRNLGHIVGLSKAVIQLKEKIKKVASSKSTILITGESGTGKELVARTIHYESNRSDKPFVAINCGAIPDTLLESELFGYVRGAFTGADQNGRIGKFELANKGTILLDEIGDMPLYLQVKILRVLQDRKIVRIGSNQTIDLDIRVIAATNKDLKKHIQENKFREDLYYRLNVIPMEVPPLRHRKEDIEMLIMNLVEKYNHLFNKEVQSIEEKTMQYLIQYSWPGNVRELENTLEFMMNMGEDAEILTSEMFPPNILDCKSESEVSKIGNTLKDVEKEHILQVLKMFRKDTKGKQQAAEYLGIGIATLYRKLADMK